MKRVVLILAAAVFTSSFIACKNDKTQTETPVENSSEDTSVKNTTANIAMADTSENNTESITGETYLYVTAPSGLSLREYNNLQSERLGRMPYGTKVRVVTQESKATMTVAGVKGSMNEVEFNHKKGFAFSGYLSKYFPPERDISVKGYGSQLKEVFPDVIYTEVKGGSASKPSNLESLTLPGVQWHEAYIIAQRLFDFPKEFAFPNPKGKSNQTVFDSKPKKGIWISQLDITRKDNNLEKIEYVYRSEGYGSTVSILKDGETMKISKTEIID